jgi:transcriptional regulator with XRE-family HTH domain
MRYAEKLYKHMLLRGFNQQKLARLSSVSDSEVSRILKGKSNPSLEYAHRLAQALGISLDYLADDRMDEDRPPPAPDLTPVEAEILEIAREFDPRQARRILETAADLGYEVAIRRLLGTEMKPIIEVGDGRGQGAESAAASIEGRVNRASSA